MKEIIGRQPIKRRVSRIEDVSLESRSSWIKVSETSESSREIVKRLLMLIVQVKQHSFS